MEGLFLAFGGNGYCGIQVEALKSRNGRNDSGFTSLKARSAGAELELLRRFCFRFARGFAFGRWRGAKALPLQPFHHHSRTHMALLGQLIRFGDERFELCLDLLRFLQRRILVALHHAQIASLKDKLEGLKGKKQQQSH
jgi:hypothetical protein